MNKKVLTGWPLFWIIIGLGYLGLILLIARTIISQEYKYLVYDKQLSWQAELRNTAFDALLSDNADEAYLIRYKYYDDSVKKSDVNSNNNSIIDEGELLLLQLNSARYSGYVDKLRNKYNKEIEDLYFKQKIEYLYYLGFWGISFSIFYLFGRFLRWLYGYIRVRWH